jgi:hypothetical protein
LEVWVASAAKDWSKPTSTVGSGHDLVGQLQGAQGVGHGADVSDHPGVLGVGLRLAGVEVGDPSHRESGQVGDLAARIPRDRQRQGADRCGLVDHDQDGAEVAAGLSKAARSLGSLLGSGLSQTLLPAGVSPCP